MNGTLAPRAAVAASAAWSHRIRPLEEESVALVALRMRAIDAREIYACRWRVDPLEIARQVCALSRFGLVAWTPAGEPAAVVCAREDWPGFYQVAMFATDAWPLVAASMTRAVLQHMRPAMLAAGARRAEARSSADHATAHAWLARLGFVAECRLPGYGKAGEEFIQFAWRRSADVHVLQSSVAAGAGAAAA
jgi:hypothetical protein